MRQEVAGTTPAQESGSTTFDIVRFMMACMPAIEVLVVAVPIALMYSGRYGTLWLAIAAVIVCVTAAIHSIAEVRFARNSAPLPRTWSAATLAALAAAGVCLVVAVATIAGVDPMRRFIPAIAAVWTGVCWVMAVAARLLRTGMSHPPRRNVLGLAEKGIMLLVMAGPVAALWVGFLLLR